MKLNIILTVQCYRLVIAQKSKDFSHKLQSAYCLHYLVAFTKLHHFKDLDNYICSSFPSSFLYLWSPTLWPVPHQSQDISIHKLHHAPCSISHLLSHRNLTVSADICNLGKVNDHGSKLLMLGSLEKYMGVQKNGVLVQL